MQNSPALWEDLLNAPWSHSHDMSNMRYYHLLVFIKKRLPSLKKKWSSSIENKYFWTVHLNHSKVLIIRGVMAVFLRLGLTLFWGTPCKSMKARLFIYDVCWWPHTFLVHITYIYWYIYRPADSVNSITKGPLPIIPFVEKVILTALCTFKSGNSPPWKSTFFKVSNNVRTTRF